jgi:hypothetical protein
MIKGITGNQATDEAPTKWFGHRKATYKNGGNNSFHARLNIFASPTRYISIGVVAPALAG